MASYHPRALHGSRLKHSPDFLWKWPIYLSRSFCLRSMLPVWLTSWGQRWFSQQAEASGHNCSPSPFLAPAPRRLSERTLQPCLAPWMLLLLPGNMCRPPGSGGQQDLRLWVAQDGNPRRRRFSWLPPAWHGKQSLEPELQSFCERSLLAYLHNCCMRVRFLVKHKSNHWLWSFPETAEGECYLSAVP